MLRAPGRGWRRRRRRGALGRGGRGGGGRGDGGDGHGDLRRRRRDEGDAGGKLDGDRHGAVPAPRPADVEARGEPRRVERVERLERAADGQEDPVDGRPVVEVRVGVDDLDPGLERPRPRARPDHDRHPHLLDAERGDTRRAGRGRPPSTTSVVAPEIATGRVSIDTRPSSASASPSTVTRDGWTSIEAISTDDAGVPRDDRADRQRRGSPAGCRSGP